MANYEAARQDRKEALAQEDARALEHARKYALEHPEAKKENERLASRLGLR